MRRITAGIRAARRRHDREDAEKTFEHDATVGRALFGLNPEEVQARDARLVRAYLGTGGKVYADACRRGWDKRHAVAFDADPEAICGGCGQRLDRHQRTS